MRPNTKITDRIDQKYREIWRKVWKSELDFVVTQPAIEYEQLGRTGGLAYKDKIKLNCILINNPKYTDEVIDQVFPHEFAHVVVRQMHGCGPKSHGVEWKNVCRVIGIEPRRCHTFPLVDCGVPKQRLTRLFEYDCEGCSEKFEFGARVYNNIKRGRRYSCTACRTQVDPTLISQVR